MASPALNCLFFIGLAINLVTVYRGTGNIMELPLGRLRPCVRPQVPWFRLISAPFRMALTWAVTELRRARDIGLNLRNGK